MSDWVLNTSAEYISTNLKIGLKAHLKVLTSKFSNPIGRLRKGIRNIHYSVLKLGAKKRKKKFSTPLFLPSDFTK